MSPTIKIKVMIPKLLVAEYQNLQFKMVSRQNCELDYICRLLWVLEEIGVLVQSYQFERSINQLGINLITRLIQENVLYESILNDVEKSMNRMCHWCLR